MNENATDRPALHLALARPADAGRIAQLSRDLVETGLGWSWTPARVERQIHCRDSVVLTARHLGPLVGFAIMFFGDTHAHLNLLAVNAPYQRMGIGSRLIAWLEESARVAGTFCVHLEVRAGNACARAFYRRLGYRECESLPGYYGGREAALRMMRDLRVHPAAPPDGG